MTGLDFGNRGSALRGGRRRTAARLTAAFALAGLALSIVAAPVGATTPTTWHRLNIYNNPPEHERFGCLEAATWRCGYDKLPNPKLGLGWDQTKGTFTGVDTTASWVCPDWFPGDVCDSADTVISGVGSFVFPRASGGFSVDQQLLVSDDGRLWIYWGDAFQFVCPWYPTFDAALTNDEQCVFAP
jgi:hypothetical protein